MKNKLIDLNDHLFAQLERLDDEDLTEEQLAIEIKRGHAMAAVAQQIVSNANVVLEAAKVQVKAYKVMGEKVELPGLITGGSQ